MAEQVGGFGGFSNRFPARVEQCLHRFPVKAAKRPQNRDPSFRQAQETLEFSTTMGPGSLLTQRPGSAPVAKPARL